MAALTYGMVGGGQGSLIGDTHRKAILLDKSAALVAGCFSRDYANTLQTGEELGIDCSRLYKTYEEMAKYEAERPDKIDFVVVVTPNNLHFEQCKAFLEAGIHVVCDKPLVHTIEQAEELKRIAKERDLLFAVTYTYGGNVTVKHARELIKSGALGDIRIVMGEYAQGWLSKGDGGKQGWRLDPVQSGISNTLGDIGTHIENTVAQITGLKIKRLLAKMDKVVEGHVLDDNSTVLVEYEGGVVGTYWASQICVGCDNDLRVRVYGSKGSLEWNLITCDEIAVFSENGVKQRIRRGCASIAPSAARYSRLPAAHNEGIFEAMANIYVNFCECLVRHKVGMLSPADIDFPTIDDGISGVRFVHKCVESASKGNVWVDF